MTVRHSLLAILAQGPCYGYQLRAEFERRTAGTWALNVGQVYNTLERLDRDGLVVRGATDEQGHVFWEITDRGRAEAARWLQEPTAWVVARNETAVKIAIASTTAGSDVVAVIDAHLSACRANLDALTVDDLTLAHTTPESWRRAVIESAAVAALTAEIAWLEQIRTQLSDTPSVSMALPLSPERPRRGRPARRDEETPDDGSQRTVG